MSQELCLVYLTSNLLEILESGYIKKLQENKLPYIFMTVMKSENIEIMESLNHEFYSGHSVMLIFDDTLIKDKPFYINKEWLGHPKDDLTEYNYEKILPYTNYLKNECLFTKKIKIKKYLKEVHIPIVYLHKHKREYECLIKVLRLIQEEYKNVEVKIITPEKMTYQKEYYYFDKNNSLTTFI
uniref:Uncharacterized protein n=1 Tax=viral metagenome TaxID=1070528 RepID=A0A6C0H715_9ZZZZ